MRHRHPPNPCQQAERCLGRCPVPSTLVGGSRRWTSPYPASPRPSGRASTPTSGRTSPSAQSLLLLPSRALPTGAAWRTMSPSACTPSGFRTRRPPGPFAVGDGAAPSSPAAWARPCPKVGRCRGRCPCPATRRGGRPRWRSPCRAWPRPTDPACPLSLGRTWRRPRADGPANLLTGRAASAPCPKDGRCQDRCPAPAAPPGWRRRWQSPWCAWPPPSGPAGPLPRDRLQLRSTSRHVPSHQGAWEGVSIRVA
mmetsp:Transcript_81673/g.221608  ORF Transcript_81673/g.221608 Transcript_81673/m.221608 type:complete len:253 (-) Transcript_81673:4-762(-)